MELGLFPLPLVLFPTEQIPLHIFEPRYKELIGECIEHERELGMLLETDDTLRDVGTRARVAEVLDEFDDGRLNIVIEGGERFRVIEHTEGRSFRTAEVEPVLDDDDPPEADDVERAVKLFTRLAELAEAEIETPEPDSELLSFRLAARVEFQLDVKQTILELRSERNRLRELATLFEQASAALEKARAQALRLDALAQEDPLTGLPNRRGFLRELTRAVAYRSRYGTPIALLFADLDALKPINDRYGHDVGDRVLRHVAKVLRANLRASDSVARLGGDEFAAILWHADEAAAERKARALEALVAASPLELPRGIVAAGLSVGAAALRPDDTADDVLARADAAMYGRKAQRRAGRRLAGNQPRLRR